MIIGFDNMSMEDLSNLEIRLYEYIKNNDFESNAWSSTDAATKLGCSEDEIYEGLANLSKFIKDKIWIHYDNGALRISAE